MFKLFFGPMWWNAKFYSRFPLVVFAIAFMFCFLPSNKYSAPLIIILFVYSLSVGCMRFITIENK